MSEPQATDIDIPRFEALYPELRRLARRERFRAGRPDAMQTTSLIHEAWFKLNDNGRWKDRGHFLATAAVAMRHVLVDIARSRLRLKRDGGQRIELTENILPLGMMPDDILVDLSAAVDKLAVLDQRLASVVECRFFAGYTDAEAAEALNVTERTVRRDWTKAKAWLYREMTA